MKVTPILMGFAIPILTIYQLGYAQIHELQNGSYILNDFDFNTSADHNDFFAVKGVWNNEFAEVNHSYEILNGRNYFLKLNYDVMQGGATGGWFETLKYSHEAADGVGYFDISEYDEFHLSYKGEGIFTTKFKIEFVEFGTWEKIQFPVGNVTSSWQNMMIDLDKVKINLDPSRIRNFAVVIEHDSVTENTGSLCFDNFYFVDRDEKYRNDEEFLDLISRKSFLYFTENAHPVTGLIRDRTRFKDVSSIAANGFGLAALCIGAERGWISRVEAGHRTSRILSSLLQAAQSKDPLTAAGYKGFYYHLLSIDHPIRRFGTSELSSIDSGLFLAGVILAREYFNGTGDPGGSEIRELADSLLNRVDWRWMLDQARNQFRMAWFPENESFDNYWDHYTDETILINLLAIASGKVDASTFYSWHRPKGMYGKAAGSIVQSYWGSLFTYFFAHCWVNFQQCGPDALGVDWWENSGLATRMNRQFCLDASSNYHTYSDSSWGLSACEGPDGYNGGISKSYGALPMTDGPPNHDGTVPPYGAGSTIIFFDPDPNLNESVHALKNYYNNYPRLWNIYGFADAYNLGSENDPSDDWYANDYIGIDTGPLLIMIENYRTGLIWDYFMNNENIQMAMEQIFDKKPVSTIDTETIRKQILKLYPIPTDQNLTIAFSSKSRGLSVLKILDLNGKEITKLKYEISHHGSQTIILDLIKYDLKPGVYFIQLNLDKLNIVSKFIYR